MVFKGLKSSFLADSNYKTLNVIKIFKVVLVQSIVCWFIAIYHNLIDFKNLFDSRIPYFKFRNPLYTRLWAD